MFCEAKKYFLLHLQPLYVLVKAGHISFGAFFLKLCRILPEELTRGPVCPSVEIFNRCLRFPSESGARRGTTLLLLGSFPLSPRLVNPVGQFFARTAAVWFSFELSLRGGLRGCRQYSSRILLGYLPHDRPWHGGGGVAKNTVLL